MNWGLETPDGTQLYDECVHMQLSQSVTPLSPTLRKRDFNLEAGAEQVGGEAALHSYGSAEVLRHDCLDD